MVPADVPFCHSTTQMFFFSHVKVHYLIEEGVDTGKGANSVVSMVHHYLKHNGMGAKHLTAHADNCIGQNKNNTMMQVN